MRRRAGSAVGLQQDLFILLLLWHLISFYCILNVCICVREMIGVCGEKADGFKSDTLTIEKGWPLSCQSLSFLFTFLGRQLPAP